MQFCAAVCDRLGGLRQERIEMERHQGYEQYEHGEPIIAEGAPAPRPTKEQIKKILAAYPIVKCKVNPPSTAASELGGREKR